MNRRFSSESLRHLVLTSGLLIFILSPAIGQQQQQQQQQPSSNTLTAKLLNNHQPLDHQNANSNFNRDVIVNNHLTSIRAQSAPTNNHNGPRDIMFNQAKIITVNDYTEAVNQQLLELRKAFITRSFKFDEQFRNLVSNSKRQLHTMFTGTYGVMYERNTEIFTEMYGNLEQYYDSGQINLTKSMDEFFANLYKRVFQVYNQGKQYTNTYLECVSDRLNEMKPFKDVPDKLIKSIRYTFVAARTILKSLNEGIDIIKNILALGVSPQCNSLINDKLVKYQRTQTSNRLPPCPMYCEQVISRCIGLNNLDQLNEKWRAYVVSLNELAHKLTTSYNIETIIAPLDVQISEAIMNFQENAFNITLGVHRVCGSPPTDFGSTAGDLSGAYGSAHAYYPPQEPAPRYPTNRLARSANPYDYQNRRAQQTSPQRPAITNENRYKMMGFQRLAQELNHRTLDQVLRSEQKSSTTIDEIRKYISASKAFWSSLPNSVCASVLGLNSSITNSPLAGHKKLAMNCYSEPFSITDTNSDTRFREEIRKQADYLDVVRQKIDDALEGVEVDWSSHEQYQKVPGVSNQIQMIGAGSRQGAPMFTSSTTISSADPVTDDEETDEYDPVESGSGDDENCPEEDPDNCESHTQDPEQDISEDSLEEETSSSTPISEAPQTVIPEPIEENDIDKAGGSLPKDISNDLVLITAPNQAGFQKSGQTSHKLVINFEGQIMLSSIVSMALLLVTTFSTRSRTISLGRR